MSIDHMVPGIKNRTSKSEYTAFKDDFSGIVCISCHEPVVEGEKIFVLNYGREVHSKPLAEYLNFTGMIWHRRCLDVTTLPGCAGRDGIMEDLDELHSSRHAPRIGEPIAA